MTTSSHNARTIAVCFAAAMSVTALVLTAVTWTKMHSSIAKMYNTMALRMEWERTLSLVKDAETGQRGFLLTGSEDYLTPFELAKSSLPEALQKLTALSVSAGHGDEEIKEVGEVMRQLLDEMSGVVVVRRREGLDAALQVMQEGAKKQLMDAIRSKVSQVITEQDGFISEGTKTMQMDLRWGYVSAISTGAMALLAGVVALFLLREAHFQARREERLVIEKKRAEDSNQQKSNFLATMSHEIRTPMNAILGFGELLQDEVRTEKEKRYVQSILTGGRSLLQLINDILDLSKIEAGMMQLKEEPVDVRDLGAFVQQLFAQQATEKGLTLRVEVDEKVPHSLLLDGVRLRQILINVVGNALKFTDSGKVELLFHTGGSEVASHSRLNLHMDIEDTGRGIAPESQREIFQPFVQVEEGPGRVNHGTGLGLAIVKRLTELIHGRVSLKSELGKGTKFSFVFPEVTVSARLPLMQSMREEDVNFDDLKPSRILVADDNETNRELMKGIFEGTRHSVQFARDGMETLKMAAAEPPDVLLMDIRMPKLDGREALRVIRGKKGMNLTPVIAVTASSLSDDERQLRSSFDGYVRKPFSRAQLYHELAQFVPRADAVEAPSEYLVAGADQLNDEQKKTWRDVAARLRDTERDVWPGIRDGMLMSEVKAFAVNLQETGKTSQCGVLESYAKRLLADIESFSLSALENGLQAFPNCINEIELRANQSPHP